MTTTSPSESRSDFDLVIIGGGITGAGILREAVRNGMASLLVEQRDFAWGTSSRSTKMIHGGLRYLKQGKFRLTRQSVRHRQRLLRELPGLVEPCRFVFPVYRGQKPGKWLLGLGLTIYDFMSGGERHGFLGPEAACGQIAGLRGEGLLGAYDYLDAVGDDARLVQRLVNESVANGGRAQNDTRVVAVNRDRSGNVAGVELLDSDSGEQWRVNSRCVINATGVWADTLQPPPHKGLRIRPLRGSHLVFAASVLPLKSAMNVFHPRDRRPMMLVPWFNSTIVGTTDLDHEHDLSAEPCISRGEVDYLFEALDFLFPGMGLNAGHCQGTFSGVRSVLSRGGKAPSQESREHAVWGERGLFTVTGGKLTTFRQLAWDVLRHARLFLPARPGNMRRQPVLRETSGQERPETLQPHLWRELVGRQGALAGRIASGASAADLQPVGGSHVLWAELPWIAEHEMVRHLDDLMLRRTRLGLLTPGGGEEHLERIQRCCTTGLGWSAARWEQERKNYLSLWRRCYGPPVADSTIGTTEVLP